jgi:hypothetical protein
MKLPKWTNDNIDAADKHAVDAILAAAYMCKREAAAMRKKKQPEAAREADWISNALLRVAAGMSWKEAFEL